MSEQDIHYPAIETAGLAERLIFGGRPSIIMLFSPDHGILAVEAYQLKPEARLR